MTQFRQAPTYEQGLQEGSNTTRSWYRWFQAIDTGTPPSTEKTLSPAGSPYTYQAPSGGFVIVSGGTVSAIQFSRTPGTFWNTGQTSGTFPVSQNDTLQISYSSIPNITFVPQ